MQNSALRLVSSSFANFCRSAASFLACSCAMCAQCLGNARFFVYRYYEHQNIVEKAAAVERNLTGYLDAEVKRKMSQRRKNQGNKCDR